MTSIDDYSKNGVNVYGTDYEDTNLLPDSNDITDGELMTNSSELALRNAREIQLTNNSRLIQFDEKTGKQIGISKTHLTEAGLDVQTIIESKNSTSLIPVPDTIITGVQAVRTTNINPNGTTDVLWVPSVQIVASTPQNTFVVSTNPNGVQNTSIQTTDSSADIAILLQGRRVAKTWLTNKTNSNVSTMCSATTAKGSKCARKATKGFIYCSTHCKKHGNVEDEKKIEVQQNIGKEVNKKDSQDFQLNEVVEQIFYDADEEFKEEVVYLTKKFYEEFTNVYDYQSLKDFAEGNLSEYFFYQLNDFTEEFTGNVTSSVNWLINIILNTLRDSLAGVYTFDSLYNLIYESTEFEGMFDREDDEEDREDEEVQEQSELERLKNNNDDPNAVSIDTTKDREINEALSETADTDSESEISQMDTAKKETPVKPKQYKRTFNLIGKTIKINKFREMSSNLTLGYSKVIPNKIINEINPLPLNSEDEKKITPLPFETESVYKFRSDYTERCFQMGAGNLKWSTCVALGKMKVNIIKYGAKYDQAMTNLLEQVDKTNQ
jgi:hypothetical protein